MLVRSHSEVSLLAYGHYGAVQTTTDKHKNESICFKIPFCLVNIFAPLNCTEMLLYSKFAYGYQFSDKKNYETYNRSARVLFSNACQVT